MLGKPVMTPSPATPAKHDPYAALRTRGYATYSIGWVTSILGQQMASVAIGWDIYQRTGSAMSLGWVGLVQAIPVIVLALPAGQMADKLDRRKIVICTQMIVALAAVALAAVSSGYGSGPLISVLQRVAGAASMNLSRLQIELGLMYCILGLAACAGALGGPARSALLPQIVSTSLLSNAIAWNSSFFQIASMVGPAIGGFLLPFTVSGVYLIDAVFAMVFAVALLLLKIRPAERTREPASFRTLTEGIRFVFKNQIILATITLDLFAVLLGGAVFLLPVFADRLGVGPAGFGWLRAAPAIGAFLMAMLITHLPPMKNAGRAMLLAVAAFGAATIVFGLTPVYRDFVMSHDHLAWLGTPIFGVRPWYWIALIALALTGAFDNISVVVRHTLVQVLAPDSMRGRVSAVNNVFIGASNELGGFESGLTAKLFGPVWSVIGGGIGTIVVVIAAAITWPKLRKFGSLHDAKPIEHEVTPLPKRRGLNL